MKVAKHLLRLSAYLIVDQLGPRPHFSIALFRNMRRAAADQPAAAWVCSLSSSTVLTVSPLARYVTYSELAGSPLAHYEHKGCIQI